MIRLPASMAWIKQRNIFNLFKFRKPGPLGQVRASWLCRRHMTWNDGILEGWNNGFRRMKSFFDTAHKSEINPPVADRFLTPNIPLFHHSIIPLDVSK